MVHRTRNEVQNLSVLPKYSRNYVSEVLQEMEAVGHLYGARCRSSCGLGVLAATVPAHYLHPRVLREPLGERVRASVRQNVHQFATFEIHQDRPVAASPAESEVVHAQFLGRSVGPKPRRTDVV